MPTDLRAVLWDFGGVILSSPFEAFNHYEAAHHLPVDFIRTVNTHNPQHNAWARLERNELSAEAFDEAFRQESAALGHSVPGADVLQLLAGEIRPQMVAALDAVIAAGFHTACLTNNVSGEQRRDDVLGVLARFEVLLESSKIGVRKPQPEIYLMACELLDVTPAQCVFLDDLGINLKPAAALGMRTIKVGDPDIAIAELGGVLGIDL